MSTNESVGCLEKSFGKNACMAHLMATLSAYAESKVKYAVQFKFKFKSSSLHNR